MMTWARKMVFKKNRVFLLREGCDAEAQGAAAKLARAFGIHAGAGKSPSMANTPQQPDPATNVVFNKNHFIPGARPTFIYVS